MFTCDFSKKGSMTLCDFLIDNIKSKIINRTLKPNEKLPSKRALALHLGVSVITVQNAYAELISEGYIYSIEKKGFYVTELPLNNEAKITRKKNINLQESKTQNIFVDLKSNSIGWQKFPFSVWSKLTREILNSPHENLLQNQPPKGTLILREAISKYLKNFKNIDVSVEQIIIGAGTEILYNFIVHLLGSEKIFAVENPGYKKISKLIEMNGAKVVPISIDKDGLDVKALKKTKASVVHVTPAHHFPTGIVMSVKRRLELLEWASKNEGNYIIEDEYDSEFRFNGKPITPLLNATKNDNVIYINTFSKTLSPSFRISYMILPKELSKEFNKKLGFCSCTVSALEQYTMAKFINEEYYTKHIIRMKNYYRNLRNEFIFKIENSELKGFVKIHEEEAGLHFLLSIQSELSDNELKTKLENQGIKIALLKDFFYDAKDFINQNTVPIEKTFVVNYSGIEKQKIPEVIQRILEAIKN